jgi:hypothetical protein
MIPVNEPVLLQWVLRRDYWDYQLPQLGWSIDRGYRSKEIA